MPVVIWIDRRFAAAHRTADIVQCLAFPPGAATVERHTHKLVQFVPAQPNA